MAEMKRWLTIREAAAFFSIPPRTLYSLIGRGLLPAGGVLRLGRQIRINVEAIEASAALKSGRRP
jgi:excisionase family DNA binding protein